MMSDEKAMAAGVKRAGADTIEGKTRSADVVAGVGRYQLGQLTTQNEWHCLQISSAHWLQKTDSFFTSSLTLL